MQMLFMVVVRPSLALALLAVTRVLLAGHWVFLAPRERERTDQGTEVVCKLGILVGNAKKTHSHGVCVNVGVYVCGVSMCVCMYVGGWGVCKHVYMYMSVSI